MNNPYVDKFNACAEEYYKDPLTEMLNDLREKLSLPVDRFLVDPLKMEIHLEGIDMYVQPKMK